MEPEHHENLPLAETFYSPDDLIPQRCKMKVPTLNRTFYNGKMFGPLRFTHWDVSLYSGTWFRICNTYHQ
jgi:hypothetical protein